MPHRTFTDRDRLLGTPIHVRLIHWILRSLLQLLFRLEIKGTAHLPASGGFVLVANHISRFDPLLLLATLPLRPRIWFLAAAQHTVALPWRRRFLRVSGGIIPIYERNPRSGRRALRDAMLVIHGGGVVGIFPEGRVGNAEGVLQPLKPGAALLALRTGAPVVPVWIAGARRVYWRKPIQIIIGKPLTFSDGITRDAAVARIQEELLVCREQTAPVPEPEHARGLWLNRLL